MASKSAVLAKFCKCSYSEALHPLYVGIYQNHITSILGEKAENGSVVAITQVRSPHGWVPRKSGHCVSELFVCLQIIDTECPLDCGAPVTRDGIQTNEAVILHTSNCFHTHYKLESDFTVLIRPVRVFPLQKVVLSAKSRASYEWCKGHSFSTGMLVASCKQKLLARAGDILLVPLSTMTNGKENKQQEEIFQLCSNLVSLECEPCKQGTITVHTSVVVMPFEENNITESQSLEISPSCDDDLPVLLSDFTSCLNTVDFTASLLCLESVKAVEASNTFTKIKSSKQFTQTVTTALILKPIVVPQSDDLQQITNAATCCTDLGQVDLSICVGVTQSTLIKLHNYNGGWVSLYMEEAEKEGSIILEVETTVQEKQIRSVNSRKPQLARVFVVGDENGQNESEGDVMTFQDSCIYLSPVMWFNIQQQPSSLIQCDSQIVVKSVNPDTSDNSESVPVAKELHIALVKSPFYSMYSKFDDAVKKHFSISRLVNVDDVICVALNNQVNFKDEQPDNNSIPDIIYYKVMKVIPVVEDAIMYRVDMNLTSVFQEVPISSYVPVTMDSYIKNNHDSIWKSPLPAGLNKYVHMMEDYLVTFLQPRFGCHKILPCVLVSGPNGIGKTTVIKSLSRRLNLHMMSVNCHDLCGDTAASTEAKLKNTFHQANMCSPSICHLKNIDVLAKNKDGTGEDSRVANSISQIMISYTEQQTQWPLVVIATTTNPKGMSSDVHSCFLQHFVIEVPTEDERLEFLEAILSETPLAKDVSLSQIAKKTAGMVLGDLCAFMASTNRAAYKRIVQTCSFGNRLSMLEEKDLCSAGIQVHMKDIETALDLYQSAHSDALGAPKVPNVRWDDVGGLNDVKTDILDTIQLPLQHPELLASGLRRSGVLLYGPPGTGKTLMAKAVATECSLNFLSVKGPELINMYVGQSEENVREVFSRARNARPCVVFFDELDSLAPNRGRSGDSGGVMDRVVSQLLAELDGLNKANDVFVIGATNRPDLLDPALLRPGRFDKLLYLGVSKDKSSQYKIVMALTRKFKLGESCKLKDIVDQCPMNLTGADFYSLCSDAMLNAMKRKIHQIQIGECSESETNVSVEQDDFMAALHSLTPSVSDQELKHFQFIQHQFTQK